MRSITTTLLTVFTMISSMSFGQVQDYGKAVHLSTYFLGAQRCGDTKSWIHDACHTKDGQALSGQPDITGGWHDCGDHIKFNVTGNWAAVMYLLGYHHFPAGYPDNYTQDFSSGSGNNIPDILDEVKIQTDYLIKCYNGGSMVYQVAHGGYDHDGSFSVPHVQSTQPVNKGGGARPTYVTTACPNIIGNAAAALALMSIVYQPFDNTYAATCLQTAKDYYALVKNKTGSCGSTDCNTGSGDCYSLSSKDYKDELAMAAIALYEATNTASYLTEAKNFYNSSLWAGEIHYYGNVDWLVAAELYHVTGTSSYLQDLKDHFAYHSNATYSSSGFYKYQWSGGWGNLQYTGNEAFIAALLHKLDPNKTTAQYNFVKNNVDFILGGHNGLGNIPANYSFLIGYNEMGGGYPQRPHHKSAFGSTKLDWSLFTQETNSPGSVTYKYELKGALVGGPDDSNNYTDKIDKYENSEVCTYYNAGFTGAVAYVNKIENNLVTSLKEKQVNVVRIYPNPAQNQININLDKSANIEITDQLGKVVFSKSLNSGVNLIDVSLFKPGVYFVKDINTSKTQKFVVK